MKLLFAHELGQTPYTLLQSIHGRCVSKPDVLVRTPAAEVDARGDGDTHLFNGALRQREAVIPEHAAVTVDIERAFRHDRYLESQFS